MIEKTFAEFFAGIGLVRLGLEHAGWKAKFANDIDEKKFEMYWDNFEDAGETYLLGDVNTLRARDIPPVTLATASFPCTDLSLAGNRKGLAGAQSGTFWPFVRLLDEMDGQRPRLLLIENVPAFLSSHGGNDFADAIEALNALGYSCDAFVLDALNFVPQSRPRLFVVAMHDTPTTRDVERALARRDPRLRSRHLTGFITEHSRLAWTLLNIPPPPTARHPLARFVERLSPDSDRWWPQDRVDYLLGQMSSRHRQVVDVLTQAGKVTYATVYRRVRRGRSMAEVRADGIAGCLRTPRGGSSRQIVLALGRGRVRARFMTPRECARLMGAHNYKISVPDNQAFFGFGDAVCVPGLTWIAKHCLAPLVGYASSSPGARTISAAAPGVSP